MVIEDVMEACCRRLGLQHGNSVDQAVLLSKVQACHGVQYSNRASDRLRLIGAQDALILLRSSFTAPKILYLLRCSSSADQALSNFDAILRRAIQLITNSNFSELQWIQASLPVRDGGLGIRRVSSLALPAFVASTASTLSLQSDILSGCVSSGNNFP